MLRLLAGCALLASIALGLVSIIVSVTTYPGRIGADAPKVTDWMQGWGTAVGAGTSLLAILLTGTLLRHEMRESKHAQDEAAQDRADAAADREAARLDRKLAQEEREDAKRGLAYVVVATMPGLSKIGSQHRITGVTLRVHNFGAGPILDLEVAVRSTAEPKDLLFQTADVMGPGEMRPFDQSHRDGGMAVRQAAMDERNLVVTLRYTDMTGQRWERVDNGKPQRVSQPPASDSVAESGGQYG